MLLILFLENPIHSDSSRRLRHWPNIKPSLSVKKHCHMNYLVPIKHIQASQSTVNPCPVEWSAAIFH